MEAASNAAVVTRAEAIARHLGAGDALDAVVEAVTQAAQAPASAAGEGTAEATARAARRMGEGRVLDASAAQAASAGVRVT